jgi:hypothetical protein
MPCIVCRDISPVKLGAQAGAMTNLARPTAMSRMGLHPRYGLRGCLVGNAEEVSNPTVVHSKSVRMKSFLGDPLIDWRGLSFSYAHAKRYLCSGSDTLRTGPPSL